MNSISTVLLVDDDPATLRATEDLLHRLPYTVLPTSLPSEALETARILPVRLDILLTDVHMPGMNGFELAAGVRILHPEVKVLYMTGAVETMAVLRDKKLPHLAKPFLSEELRAALAALV